MSWKIIVWFVLYSLFLFFPSVYIRMNDTEIIFKGFFLKALLFPVLCLFLGGLGFVFQEIFYTGMIDFVKFLFNLT